VPELADGELDALVRPLPLPELLPELLVPELAVLELPDVPELERPDAGLLIDVLPEDADAEPLAAACPAPGSANATAPAAIRLTAPAVAVTARSRACPWSRSAMARLVSCDCLLIEWILPCRVLTTDSLSVLGRISALPLSQL
jgi:hypothetical protein